MFSVVTDGVLNYLLSFLSLGVIFLSSHILMIFLSLFIGTVAFYILGCEIYKLITLVKR